MIKIGYMDGSKTIGLFIYSSLWKEFIKAGCENGYKFLSALCAIW